MKVYIAGKDIDLTRVVAIEQYNYQYLFHMEGGHSIALDAEDAREVRQAWRTTTGSNMWVDLEKRRERRRGKR